MALLRVTNGFEKLSDAELLAKGLDIHQSISNHSSLFASPLPAMGLLQAGCNDLQEAMAAAANGDRIQAAQKKINRHGLIDLLHQLGYYVLFISRGNPLVAEKAEYEVARRSAPVVLAKPATPVVENGSQPGAMLVSTRRVPGARSYVFQYSLDAEPAAESWVSVACTTAKCKLAGLSRGQEYAFRVGAIGAGRQIMFSDVVKRYAS